MSPFLGSTLGSPPQRERCVLAQALDPERPSGRLEAVELMAFISTVWCEAGAPTWKGQWLAAIFLF